MSASLSKPCVSMRAQDLWEHKSACSMTSVSAGSNPQGPSEILEVCILQACLIQTPDPGHTDSGRSNKKIKLSCTPSWYQPMRWHPYQSLTTKCSLVPLGRHTGGARDVTAMRRPQASSDFIWWKRLQHSFCRTLTDTSVVKKKLSSTSGDIFQRIHEFPN